MRVGAFARGYADRLARVGIHPIAGGRNPESLTSFYAGIPFRYPRLFEQLCSSHSWEQVVLGEVEFGANPASADLSGLAASIRYDPHLWEFLTPRGYLIFGRMSGGRYDPCAFDINRRMGADVPVVRIDHEQVLSFVRLGRPSILAPSFRTLLDASVGMIEPGRRTRG